MDIFEKCYNYHDPDEVKAAGLYPYFRPHHAKTDTVVIMEGKEVIMLGSNSYLGLTSHPEVKEAAKKAIDIHGTGCAGSRFLNGTLDLHEELEKKLAKFVDKEDAIIFSTGFFANQGAISALVSRHDAVFIDRLDHASIVDGTRLGFGEVVRFRHSDCNNLDMLLSKYPDKGKIVVVDGIYSMDGDIAPLPDLIKVCKKHGARLFVDDAHSLGVLGKNGKGTANHFGVVNDVDIIMGTFSKSLAAQGGFVAGEHKVIDYIRHHSRPFIFSASLAPALLAAVDKALEIMQREPERIANLWEITRYAAKGYRQLGFDIGKAETPIIPIIIGDMEMTFKFWKLLYDNGIFVNCVIPPAVPENKCIIRTSYVATHTKEQIDKALSAFEKAGKQLGIIK
ncbi:MAG TPA: pyridoxal phosphate-dependent aminotransferase family protein [Exilispira sp.]|nr:pyridoxal phosphate-dependent aminotransferase family protein [Exilispira sp.]